MNHTWKTMEGNEAVARVAYALSDVIAIYPITPSTPMGESADAWQATGQTNLWGTVPRVIEMQSEGGAAGVLHGALQTGNETRYRMLLQSNQMRAETLMQQATQDVRDRFVRYQQMAATQPEPGQPTHTKEYDHA